MDILSSLTNLLGSEMSSGAQSRQSAPTGGMGGSNNALGGGLEELLSPAILGSLASALFPSNKMGSAAGQPQMSSGAAGGMGGLGGLLSSLVTGGALSGLSGLFGGGEAASPSGDGQAYANAAPQANPAERAVRLLRALVYAAKADGHIDQNEQAAINSQMRKLNLNQEARNLMQKLMDEPLDPNILARGVTDPREAAQLYGLSCAITGMDNFMEKSYLDGLAGALRISPQTRSAIETQIHRS